MTVPYINSLLLILNDSVIYQFITIDTKRKRLIHIRYYMLIIFDTIRRHLSISIIRN